MEMLLVQYESVTECVEKLAAPGSQLAARAAGLKRKLQ